MLNTTQIRTGLNFIKHLHEYGLFIVNWDSWHIELQDHHRNSARLGEDEAVIVIVKVL